MTPTDARLTFRVMFRGPFHVGSGTPAEGLDSTVDHEVPLPGSSLKGLMRAQALNVLQLPASVVEAIFGSPECESGWLWSDAAFERAPQSERMARLKLADTDDGAAETGFLMLGEHLWASEATFTITPRRALDPAALTRDQLVLRASARSISGLGGSRRRGEGWVSVTDIRTGSATAWTVEDTLALLRLMEVPA